MAVHTHLMGCRGFSGCSHLFCGLQGISGCGRTRVMGCTRISAAGTARPQYYYGLHRGCGWRFAFHLWGAGALWLRSHLSIVLHMTYGCSHDIWGLQALYGCVRTFSLGCSGMMAVRTLLGGCSYNVAGCSHSTSGLQIRCGWRFARLLWVAKTLWLAVRTVPVGCREIVAGGSHIVSGFQ